MAETVHVPLGAWNAREKSWHCEIVGWTAIKVTELWVDGGPASDWTVDAQKNRILWRGEPPEKPDRAYLTVSLTAEAARRPRWGVSEAVVVALIGALGLIGGAIVQGWASSCPGLLEQQKVTSRGLEATLQTAEKDRDLCKQSLGAVTELCAAGNEAHR